MWSIRCRAACNKALRPNDGSKLSPSGDVATQSVAFARRFVGSAVARRCHHAAPSLVFSRFSPRFCLHGRRGFALPSALFECARANMKLTCYALTPVSPTLQTWLYSRVARKSGALLGQPAKHLRRGEHRLVDVLRRVCGGDKPRLERRRRQVDARVEHRVKEPVEALLVAAHHRRE